MNLAHLVGVPGGGAAFDSLFDMDMSLEEAAGDAARYTLPVLF